jgi:hypothetical protein
MKKPELAPQEKAALDKERDGQRPKQPYASEVDDRELERAHKENRPVDPKGGAGSGPSR